MYEEERDCFCDMCDKTIETPSAELRQTDYWEHEYWNEKVLCQECAEKLFKMIDIFYQVAVNGPDKGLITEEEEEDYA